MTSPSTDRLYGSNSSLAMKAPCVAGTTANITLSAAQTIDGVAVVAEDRVLVKNQTDTTENGIYIADSSTWQRAPDFDGTRDVVKGTLVRISGGSTLSDSYWAVSSPNPITIGTSSITFTQSNASLSGVGAFGTTLIATSTSAAARTAMDVPSNAEAILDSIIDAKGDLIAGTAADTPAKMTAGSNGLFLETASSATPGLRWGNPGKPADGRLTLTTATPVTTADVTAAESIFYTPYVGDKIALYDGTDWRIYTFTQLTLDVPDVTGVHDVFLTDVAGTLTLAALVWTNDTTRATALAYQNGVLIKSGDTSSRYLGTFYSTTAGNGQTEDSLVKRYLWNYYNRVYRPMRVVDATNSWTTTTAAYQQANASAVNQLDFVRGVEEDEVVADVRATFQPSSATVAVSGIGLGSITNIAINSEGNISNATHQTTTALYRGFPGVGRRQLWWLEYGAAGTSVTWYGDNGAAIIQSGITGSMRA